MCQLDSGSVEGREFLDMQNSR